MIDNTGNHTNSPTERANFFTLVFDKQPLVFKMVYLQDQLVNLRTYCAYCFSESMNVHDVKDECNRHSQTRVESVEVNCKEFKRINLNCITECKLVHTFIHLQLVTRFSLSADSLSV